MACQVCGKSTKGLPYTCNRCGQEHCSDHRLPESHNCNGLKSTGGKPNYSPKSKPGTSSGGSTPYIFALAILVVLVSVGLSLGVPTDISALESADSQVKDAVNSTLNDIQETSSDEEFNETKAELEVHRLINQRRNERGLNQLAYDKELAEIAESHSKDMAKNEFFSHTSPTTGEFDDRYRSAGYTCEVRVNENRYATGGENIAKTWYKVPLETSGDDFLSSEKEVAEFIVSQWLESPGHRENILTPYWENEGIGIYTIEEDEGLAIYVTQNFC